MSADASLPVKAFDDVQFDEFYERALPVDGYGLGLFDVADPYAPGAGHTGGNLGYASWAGCLSDGSVVVVLTNREVDDIGGMARPLVLAALPD